MCGSVGDGRSRMGFCCRVIGGIENGEKGKSVKWRRSDGEGGGNRERERPSSLCVCVCALSANSSALFPHFFFVQLVERK